MADNINRAPGQTERFKQLCNDLRAAGIRKTDSEIIEASMALLKRQFLVCSKCKHFDDQAMNPEKFCECGYFEERR